jgi:hypothetical protein
MRLLIETPSRPVPLLAEELVVVAFEGRPGGSNLRWLEETQAIHLLEEAKPDGNFTPTDRTNQLRQALDWLPTLQSELANIAQARSTKLLESYRRVRQATNLRGRVTVRPQLHFDVLGVYVLLPVPKGVA